MHWAMAPFGLLFTDSPVPPVAEPELRVAFATGFEAGATLVFGADDELVVLQTARSLLYHFVQSVVVVLVLVVFVTAPFVLPVELSFAAALHCALFALPGFVQS